MNGIVSEPSSRSSTSSTSAIATTAIWMGSCLLGGFAVGSIVHNPLRATVLDFSKVAWVNPERIQLAQLDSDALIENQLNVAVEFQNFELPPQKTAKKSIKKQHIRTENVWAKLEKAVRSLKQATLKRVRPKMEWVFEDYRIAASELRRDFFYALIPTFKTDTVYARHDLPEVKQDTITTTESSANVEIRLPINKNFSSPIPLPHTTQLISKSNIHQLLSGLKVSSEPTHKPKKKINRSEAATKVAGIKTPAKQSIKMNTHDMSIQKTDSQNEFKPQSEQNVAKVSKQEIEYRPSQIEKRSSSPSVGMDRQTIEVTRSALATSEKDSGSMNLNPSLSKEDRAILAEALLNEQMKTIAGTKLVLKNAAKAAQAAQYARIDPPAKQVQNQGAQKNQPQAEDEVEEDNKGFADIEPTPTPPAAHEGCSQLTLNRFHNGSDKQICPVNHEWISKDWNGRGWMRVETAESLPTLTYYPAPNSGQVLVLEPNALAFLGLKSGTRVEKGMGMIVGLLPKGYTAEFSGRAEETEYFEIAGRKYFAMINVEPGAGVVELSTKSDAEITTVFSPVLEDTITYLDLAVPKLANFTVKVVKSGKKNDPEVAGLTVGVSTQSKVQGITQKNGRAVLKNISVVPGYPVYVDVSSKQKSERGYTYRYILKSRNRSGDYLLNQIREASLFHWIKQVKQGLSDQSAMLVGFYDAKQLGGFKEHYFVKAEPKTTKFGLEPLNYSILWDGKISDKEPLEGDLPRFMSVQVPEGLSQIKLKKESGEEVQSELFPVSPRVIHVISQ